MQRNESCDAEQRSERIVAKRAKRSTSSFDFRMRLSQHGRLAAGLALSVIPASLGYLAWYLAGVRADFGTGLLFGMLTLVGPWIGLSAFLAVTRHTHRTTRFVTCAAAVVFQYLVIFGALPPPIEFYRYGLASTVRRELPVGEFRAWAYAQAELATNHYFRISAEDSPAFLGSGRLAARNGMQCLVRRDGPVTNVTLMWNTIGVTLGPTQRTSHDRTMVADDVQVFVAVRQ